MKFEALSLAGAFVVHRDVSKDERGSFSRLFCQDAFNAVGIADAVVQANLSSNARRGTLRGMHFQKAPQPETKLVTCLKGSILDVIVDLRVDSPTHKKWEAIALDAARGTSLFVPGGFAHGFQTLEDDTTLLYFMGESYQPELAGGVRYNDPAFSIEWPLPVTVVSERDQAFPDYTY